MEYVKPFNELLKNRGDGLRSKRAHSQKLEKQKSNIIEAIKNGVDAFMVKEELEII